MTEEAILVISHDSITKVTTVEVESMEDDDGCPCYCHCSTKEECFMKYGDDEACDEDDKTVCHCWHNDCPCSTAEMINIQDRREYS